MLVYTTTETGKSTDLILERIIPIMAQKPKSNNDIYPQSPQPLYLQVRHYIEDRIRSGSWKPDTRIPSENNLVESLGIFPL